MKQILFIAFGIYSTGATDQARASIAFDLAAPTETCMTDEVSNVSFTQTGVRQIQTEMILAKWKGKGGVKDYLKCVWVICRHNPIFTCASVASTLIDNVLLGYFVYYSAVTVNNSGNTKQITIDLEKVFIGRIIGACILLSLRHITYMITTEYQPIMYKEIENAIQNKEIRIIERLYSRVTNLQSQVRQITDPSISALSQKIILLPQNCTDFISALCLYWYCGYVLESQASVSAYVFICTGSALACASVLINIAKYKEKNKQNCKFTMLHTGILALEFSFTFAQIMSFLTLLKETNVDRKITQLSGLRSFVTIFFVILARYTMFNKSMLAQCAAYKSYCDFLKREARQAKIRMRAIGRSSTEAEDATIKYAAATE